MTSSVRNREYDLDRSAAVGALRPPPIELTIVVPPLNERENIEPLVDSLHDALPGIAWEVIFIDDDSHDGTVDRIRQIARLDGRVRCLRRVGRRGLSSACLEGILASTAPYVAVMDADLQHDEALLKPMLSLLQSEPLDLVIGSRHVERRGQGGFGVARARISRLAECLSRLVLRAKVSDPMSGLFMMRREALDAALPRLSAIGFKILIDLFASSPTPLRFSELSYQFRMRERGRSKLDARVVCDYLLLLVDKLVGRVLPVRLVLFGLIGALGIFVHLAVLRVALTAGSPFAAAQLAATTVAMVGNFVLNNTLTYRDRRLRGRRFWWGLLSFAGVCSVGAALSVVIASIEFAAGELWWIAGGAGALIGALWNYTLSSAMTWGRPDCR
jgi:dolichol-phosphate mannosyltransferase